uniref:U-box domain-containing protein n=1 Tax=Mantoniella antarctica TaxID=81844 RepID=A0A7S0SK23_9CHLO
MASSDTGASAEEFQMEQQLEERLMALTAAFNLDDDDHHPGQDVGELAAAASIGTTMEESGEIEVQLGLDLNNLWGDGSVAGLEATAPPTAPETPPETPKPPWQQPLFNFTELSSDIAAADAAADADLAADLVAVFAAAIDATTDTDATADAGQVVTALQTDATTRPEIILPGPAPTPALAPAPAPPSEMMVAAWQLLRAAAVKGHQIPQEFYDCITCEVMLDPVIAWDGHTYERTPIVRWLAEHSTSPMTGETLPDFTLRPNHSMRSQIINYGEKLHKEGCE